MLLRNAWRGIAVHEPTGPLNDGLSIHVLQ